MKTTFFQWVLARSRRMINSIAFYPAVISTVFLVVSILMVYLDYSEQGKSIKSSWSLLRLRDASTARSIISAIAAGIISLTVFSFSMVMIVLNQAASQMSNRILDKLIGNRYQQVVLGFYIGTIVYALFLLSTIRDIDSGIYVPSLSTYLLIILAVGDIFLFIYFLHYITQSVKYEVIINRIHHQTKKALSQTCRLNDEPEVVEVSKGHLIVSPVSGIFTSFNRDGLIKVVKRINGRLTFLYPLGSFILKDAPLLSLSASSDDITEEWKEEMMLHIFITEDEAITNDFNYGFRQLKEVAVKALSPGVNDPGTAVTSLRALIDLLAFRLKHFPDNTVTDEDCTIRIVTKEPTFEQLFLQALLPIWDYGKDDRMVQNEMHDMLLQLQSVRQHPVITRLLVCVQKKLAADPW